MSKKENLKHRWPKIKTNNKHFFKYIRSRKLTREADGPLGNKGMKGMFIKDGELAEKMNKFFSSIITVECGHIPCGHIQSHCFKEGCLKN